MNNFSPTDMKTVLHSKRANLYYLEHCRVLVNGGRVEYVTETEKRSQYWNIPIANTTFLLLGTGTSITQAAMRELAKAGVSVGFCGSDGTPLFTATERDTDIVWFDPQSEYRSTEYIQAWMRFWFDDAQRLAAAKMMLLQRLNWVQRHWLEKRAGQKNNFTIDADDLNQLLDRSIDGVNKASSVELLTLEEARLTKQFFKLAAQTTEYGAFTRAHRVTGIDRVNQFLDQGNYLAYGLARVATWVLGLSHAFAVSHGKTRRGGLVFDAADLIKDAVILPQAFISAVAGDEPREFRQSCTNNFMRTEALDFMIDSLKEVAHKFGGAAL